MFVTVFCLVLLSLCTSNNHVFSYPYGGGNNQWSNPPMVGAMGGRPQQQQTGFGGGRRASGNDNFGGHQGGGGGGGGYSRGRGGRQPWQSGQGNEAYQTNVFNEPDRYGYDSTFPGATVHYLMYKKQGNRGSGNHGGSQGGWNNNY